MAKNIIVQVVGGSKRVIDSADSVGDVRKELAISSNYKASVNGEGSDDSTQLRTGDFVAFSEAVKGA